MLSCFVVPHGATHLSSRIQSYSNSPDGDRVQRASGTAGPLSSRSPSVPVHGRVELERAGPGEMAGVAAMG